MSNKECRKCGHIATFDLRAPESCSNCGAIYKCSPSKAPPVLTSTGHEV